MLVYGIEKWKWVIFEAVVCMAFPPLIWSSSFFFMRFQGKKEKCTFFQLSVNYFYVSCNKPKYSFRSFFLSIINANTHTTHAYLHVSWMHNNFLLDSFLFRVFVWKMEISVHQYTCNAHNSTGIYVLEIRYKWL